MYIEQPHILRWTISFITLPFWKLLGKNSSKCLFGNKRPIRARTMPKIYNLIRWLMNFDMAVETTKSYIAMMWICTLSYWSVLVSHNECKAEDKFLRFLWVLYQMLCHKLSQSVAINAAKNGNKISLFKPFTYNTNSATAPSNWFQLLLKCHSLRCNTTLGFSITFVHVILST